MNKTQKEYARQILRISGAQDKKCMRCGKCSATCPSYDDMDIKPNQFISYLQNNDVDTLLKSQTLYKCLSCFCCVERCPRDVRPARLIEATRIFNIRSTANSAYLEPENIQELLDEDLPGQLLASAFRKYSR